MKTQEIQNLIENILSHTHGGVKEIVAEEVINKDGTSSVWFKVVLDDAYSLLSKDASGLFALNHLVKRIAENKSENPEQENRFNFIIDVNDFQKKKVDSVKALAHMMAERARYFKSSVELDPMPSFERRIIHEFLSDALDLKTESIGYGPDRKVIIKYTGSI